MKVWNSRDMEFESVGIRLRLRELDLMYLVPGFSRKWEGLIGFDVLVINDGIQGNCDIMLNN